VKRPDGPDAVHVGSEIHRRVAVKGSGGVDAMVLVIVRRGRVWLSVTPPFTWEAIMAADNVDELTRALQLARDEAQADAVQAAEAQETARRGDGHSRHG
jgi:hypothetical protein